MTDPIADMLTRIRNAQMSKRGRVEIPTSKLKKNIALILNREGYIGAIEEVDAKPTKKLVLELKYSNKKPAISSIKRESKPGHRVYCKSDEIPRILNDFGIAILSTSKGLMTNKEARKEKLGGEIICSIY
ncbi:30S ribosomal protein S8 [Patescibacteria group bacterium]|nr:30S ribosomal protein S8 [Patescibacteria group bacterium]